MSFISPPPPEENQPRRLSRRRPGWSLRLTPGGLIILLLLNGMILGLLAWPLVRARLLHDPIPTRVAAAAAVETHTPTPFEALLSPAAPSVGTMQAPQQPTSTVVRFTPEPYTIISLDQGLFLLALDEGGNTHIFAYQPRLGPEGQGLPLTRLTFGPWDDVQPALSPDGSRVAFSSNRSGYWDLYTMELTTGSITRVTDSLEYDGSPSWSPDGLWLAYETYQDENLEIAVKASDGTGESIRLTNSPSSDYAPAWSPQGRLIAFVSNRSGEPEIWLADLDKVDESLFQNLSHDSRSIEAHPVWSPDGSKMVWASEKDGFRSLNIWQRDTGRVLPAGSGDWPVWGPDGKTLATLLLAPNQTYLTAYDVNTPGLVLPPVHLPGDVQGIAWGDAFLPWPLRDPYKQASVLTPTPLWLPALTPDSDRPEGRSGLVNLKDVEAPYPVLHDMVDESFQALRLRTAGEVGWDFLSSLENAYVPLTSVLGPGMLEDWLFTGRGFAFSTVPVNAGWVMVVRETFGSQTFWRVYLRARFQDGSAGIPLHEQPWDFFARYGGNAQAYEDGGALLEQTPPGYWFDFTRLAIEYGWERQPALSTWRSAYPAAKFNEFVLSDDLDWHSAMLELYPSEALITPSPIVPPTRTPTLTPRWYQTPTTTLSPTPRPTRTPVSPTVPATATELPSQTPTATTSPTASRSPTRTPTRTPSPTAGD